MWVDWSRPLFIPNWNEMIIRYLGDLFSVVVAVCFAFASILFSIVDYSIRLTLSVTVAVVHIVAVGAINVLAVAFLLFMCVIQFKSTPAGIMEYLALLGFSYMLVLLINMNFICKHNNILSAIDDDDDDSDNRSSSTTISTTNITSNNNNISFVSSIVRAHTPLLQFKSIHSNCTYE